MFVDKIYRKFHMKELLYEPSRPSSLKLEDSVALLGQVSSTPFLDREHELSSKKDIIEYGGCDHLRSMIRSIRVRESHPHIREMVRVQELVHVILRPRYEHVADDSFAS